LVVLSILSDGNVICLHVDEYHHSSPWGGYPRKSSFEAKIRFSRYNHQINGAGTVPLHLRRIRRRYLARSIHVYLLDRIHLILCHFPVYQHLHRSSSTCSRQYVVEESRIRAIHCRLWVGVLWNLCPIYRN
jgi:hypothetical protein